jgi:spore germination protein GerM
LKKSKLPPRDRMVLFIAFFICAVVLGALMLKKYEMRHRQPPLPAQPQQQGLRLVALFFASPDGAGLVREGREIDSCAYPAECVEEVVVELINGPLGNLAPTLPPSTSIRSVRINGDVAQIDLGEEVVKALPGGSNSEMAAVYSIVNTIAVNFPRIRQVKLMINGRDVETLRGELDLRAPLAPDFTLERK